MTANEALDQFAEIFPDTNIQIHAIVWRYSDGRSNYDTISVWVESQNRSFTGKSIEEIKAAMTTAAETKAEAIVESELN